jgi:hypothetical protein
VEPNNNAWFVGLGRRHRPGAGVPVVAQTLGADGSPHRDPAELLKSHLLGRAAFLVLGRL